MTCTPTGRCHASRSPAAGPRTACSCRRRPRPPAGPSTWRDEFDGPRRAPSSADVDRRRRRRRLGQQELEFYTPRRERAPTTATGQLVITRSGETLPGSDGIGPQVHLGAAEDPGQVRAGLRPLRGAHAAAAPARAYGRRSGCSATTSASVGWPQPAARSTSWRTSAASRHRPRHAARAPATRAATGSAAPSTCPAARFADDFHVFAVEWEPDVDALVLDGNALPTTHPTTSAAGAVGLRPSVLHVAQRRRGRTAGPGARRDDHVSRSALLVDYVRVYGR